MSDSTAHRLGGRYELRSLIGRGGMAEVHLGFDTRLNRVVAIKRLRTDLARDSVFQARFRREAQSAASLNHPNIVAVYDTSEENLSLPDGRTVAVPYIVMEYVEGHTVKDLLSDGTPVPIDEAVEIVSGVLAALEYSHARHLVHRDIKPGNIMLTNDGTVKVMDFGIARALTDSQATMTQTNAVVGTAQYLSPEQARGEQVDARSDLYSTGVVLFELLTGRPPFRGESAVSVAYQHVQELPPLPSSITPDIPEALDRVVMKALAKNREERYASATSMRADLIRALRGADVNAPETAVWANTLPVASDATRTMPLDSRQWTGPTRAGAATASHTTTLPRLQEEAAEEPEKKGRAWLVAALVAVALVLVAGAWYLLTQGGGTDDTETVAVPQVLGLTQEQAKTAIEGVGLKFAIDDARVTSDQYEKDTVAEADPAPGEMAPLGSTVTVKLSDGPKAVTIPDDLKGKDFDEVKKALGDLGLKVERGKDEPSKDVEKDKVIRTNPEMGKSVPGGSTVTVYVSTGPDTVDIPDLSSYSQDQARDALTQLGLTLGNVKTEDSPTVEKDKVIRTEPEAGKTVDAGTSVVLVISTGTVTIPDGLIGRPQAEVTKTLTDLGLTVQIYEQNNEAAAGIVFGIDPRSGSVAQRSTVRIYVSKGQGNQPATGGDSSGGNTDKPKSNN